MRRCSFSTWPPGASISQLICNQAVPFKNNSVGGAFNCHLPASWYNCHCFLQISITSVLRYCFIFQKSELQSSIVRVLLWLRYPKVSHEVRERDCNLLYISLNNDRFVWCFCSLSEFLLIRIWVSWWPISDFCSSAEIW